MNKLDKFSSKKLNNQELKTVEGGATYYYCDWAGWGYCLIQRKKRRTKCVCDNYGCACTVSGQGCC